MKPQAAGHTRARPPWAQAPGEMGTSGHTHRQDQRPGSSHAANPLAPAPARSRPDPLLLAASFGHPANTNKTDRHFRQREDGACGRAQCRSLGMNTART